MRCPNCGYENPEGRRYCEECGEKIATAVHMREASRRKTMREAARQRRMAEQKGVDVKVLERRARKAKRKTKPWMGVALLVLIVAGVVIGLVFAFSGGKSGPEESVMRFFEALNKRDVMGFLRCTEPELYKAVRSGAVQLPAPEETFGYDRYEAKAVVTRLNSLQEDRAEVEIIGGKFIGYYKDGGDSGGVDFSTYPRKIHLIKLENQWIILDYSLAMQPFPLPEIEEEGSEFPEV